MPALPISPQMPAQVKKRLLAECTVSFFVPEIVNKTVGYIFNWMLLLATVALAASAPQPTVLWGASPVMPGERLILAVAGIAQTANATAPSLQVQQGGGKWQKVDAVGVTDYGCTISVPTSFTPGTFKVRASSTDTGYTVNTPRPWFAFGDQGDSVRVV